LYIRESRRMIGEYVMTQANCEGKRKVNDGIALGAYTMDSHNCQRIVVKGQVKNEGNVEVGGFGPYPISYRAIVPKKEEATNLLVPVCLSATHIAYGSIRMEPVFMVLGQSAAAAAVMAMDQQVSVQDVPVKELQHQLKINPLAEWAPPDILCDNADTRHARASSKKWQVVTEGGYGRDFMITDPTRENKFLSGKEKRVETFRFAPGNRQPGDYRVFIYIPMIKGISDNLLVKISDGLRIQERILQTKGLVVEGQTSGEWISLGQQTIMKTKKPWVEVTTVGANGKVVADAVIWVPLTNEPPPAGNQ